jgi:hypothetical protein
MSKKEISARYREKNREKLRLVSAKYRTENLEKVKEDKQTHYQKYRESILARRRVAYAQNPPPKVDPRKRKNTTLKSKYGTNIEHYEFLIKKQNGKCAICKETQTKSLHLDHCHATGKIRGLLCFKCNSALGKFMDSKAILNNAINYLEEYL